MTAPWSLRNHVRWWTTCAGGLVLVAAALTIYVGIRHDLHNNFDQLLHQRVLLLSRQVQCDESGELAVTITFDHYPEFIREPLPDYWECRLTDGRVLFRSPGLLTRDAALPVAKHQFVGTQFSTLKLPDGRIGRAITITMSAPTQEHTNRQSAQLMTMMLATDTATLDTNLSQLAWLLGCISAAALIAIALVMDQMARWLISPLDQLAESITQLGSEGLHQRLQAGTAPRELMPVINRLNELLKRLEQTVLRERGFSADLAHELRTPLSGLLISLEVALRHSRSVDDYQTTLRECQEICVQMTAMVETMLTLARADNGNLTTRIGPIDVEQVLESSWRLVDHEAQERGLQVQWDLEPVQAVADESHVRLIVNNLMTNAVSYTNAGGTITISARSFHNHAVLSISNTGCTLEPAQAQQVFERFWRGDQSRTNTGLHCGLGLTLCRTLASMNDGQISTRIADGRFTITVKLHLFGYTDVRATG